MFNFILLLLFSFSNATTVPDEIVLLATYREFLSVHCLNDARVPGGVDFIEKSWDKAISQLSPFFDDSCERYFDNLQYSQALSTGTISGHPDFEAFGFFADQNDCSEPDPTTGLNFPVGTCVFEEGSDDHQIVNPRLKIGLNGLPSIEYCNDNLGDDSRCGFVGDRRFQSQTNKGNFDKWFNDDEKYNRRIGQRLVLTKSDDSQIFKFVDTGADSPDFPEDDNGVDFGPFDIFKVGGSREISLNTPPDDVCSWPQSASNQDFLSRGFWFTTEIHTTFEFRKDEKMDLTFKGDDDFFAFINGKLAVDVGGMHGERTKSIDLNSGNEDFKFFELLDLKDREIYTLDIYHAERQRFGSNFQLETTLFANCNVQQSGKNSISFVSENGEVNQPFVLQGVDITGDTFKLMSANQLFSANHIFTKAQENVSPGFQAKFLAKIDGDVEGFAFVVQSFGVSQYPRSFGSTLNLKIENSLAIVFDLCLERVADGSCSKDQEVRVHYPSTPNKTNSVEKVRVEDGGTMRVHDRIARNLRRNEAFPVEIIFYGERPNFLEVYVNNSLYLRESDFNLREVIGADGAHVGFTSSSGATSGSIEIEKFELKIVEVDTTKTKFVASQDENTRSVVADGKEVSEGFVIFTEDLCGNAFGSGTQAELISAKYLELPDENGAFKGAIRHTVDAVIVDNLNGTYHLQLQTTVPGEYELVMAFGDAADGCGINLIEKTASLQIAGNTIIVTDIQPELAGSLTECSFVTDFKGRVVATAPVIPPTNSPIDPSDLENDFDVIPFVSIGSGLCFFLIVAGIGYMWYRRKWGRDRKFVAPGNAFKQEANTVYNDQTEYSVVARNVLSTQEEILALEAAAKGEGSEEAADLAQENENLKEMITDIKKELQYTTSL